MMIQLPYNLNKKSFWPGHLAICTPSTHQASSSFASHCVSSGCSATVSLLRLCPESQLLPLATGVGMLVRRKSPPPSHDDIVPHPLTSPSVSPSSWKHKIRNNHLITVNTPNGIQSEILRKQARPGLNFNRNIISKFKLRSGSMVWYWFKLRV